MDLPVALPAAAAGRDALCDGGLGAVCRWPASRSRPAASPGAASALWARIDHELVDQAPWVPLYNPRELVVLSARVGNYQFDPNWNLLVDQLWVS